MATQFLWTGALGLSNTDWNGAVGVLTNWRDLADNSTTLTPGSIGDEARFTDGGADTVSGTGGADQVSIEDNTFVTLSNGHFGAGDLFPANNAEFPDDLVVDDDSKLIVASDAAMTNQGSVSVIGLGADLFGGTGNGTLEVDPGGGFGAEAMIIGDGTAGNGVVMVNGAAGFFVVEPAGSGSGDGELTIGQMGTGSLSITNTPAVFTESAVLGLNLGAAGVLTMDSSTWGGGDLTVGSAGTGHVTIGSGGVVALANIILGLGQSGSGDLSVGAASFGADFLTVGADGTGTAAFAVGSTGTFAAVTVGASVDAIATLVMDGSAWNTGSLTIGLAGAGHATAGGGEDVTFNNAVLGSGEGVNGDLTIDGAALNGGTLAVGLDGTGDLAIVSGSTGSVSSVILGEDQGSSGTLTIDDADWNVGSLMVGLTGAGQATVGNGATAALGTIAIGPNGGLAVTEAAGAVGTVTAQQATLEFGTLDLSQGGQMLIGATAGTNGAVAIGSTSSLSGLGLLRGDVELAADGVVQATGPVPGALKIDGNIHGAGTIQPLMTLEANGVIDPGVTIAFGRSTGAEVGDLVLDVATGEQGTIDGFGAGNTIDVQRFLYSSAVFTQGTSGEAGSLVLSGGTSAPLSLAVLGSYAPDAFTATPGVTDTIVTVVPCFVAGTRIRCERGDIPVEALRIGDRVHVVDGGESKPVVWLGHRRIDCSEHPLPAQVWPIRISAGAIAPECPCRDLFLSPDHALFIRGALIPARYLVNGRTIAQQRWHEVTYWHVELAEHDVLYAEGAPAESYLDTGNRVAFTRVRDAHRVVPV